MTLDQIIKQGKINIAEQRRQFAQRQDEKTGEFSVVFKQYFPEAVRPYCKFDKSEANKITVKVRLPKSKYYVGAYFNYSNGKWSSESDHEIWFTVESDEEYIVGFDNLPAALARSMEK